MLQKVNLALTGRLWPTYYRWMHDVGNNATSDEKVSQLPLEAKPRATIDFGYASSDSPETGRFLRLNKALARSGLCSRRAADELILKGAVMVNGSVTVAPGKRIDPDADQILVHGSPLPVMPSKAGHLYLAVHKPPGVVTTAHDPQGRKTVLDLLDPDLRRRRPFPVGRLDLLSEGLLLLTTDGELALRMTHPRWKHPKTYHVRVRGRLDADKLRTMRGGMRLAEGDQLAPVEVQILDNDLSHSPKNEVTLKMILRQGVNRQIRRMCRDLRLHILRLQRVSQGPIQLGDLPSGTYRRLTRREIDDLRASLDLSQESA